MDKTQVESADFQKLCEMIKEIDFCMLTTVDENNDLRSRPMSLNSEVDQEGNLLFSPTVTRTRLRNSTDAEM